MQYLDKTKARLKPGEVICIDCEGSGLLTDRVSFYYKCPRCKGWGKIDWIENILGKKPRLLTTKQGV